jgi:hypothetical protein
MLGALLGVLVLVVCTTPPIDRPSQSHCDQLAHDLTTLSAQVLSNTYHQSFNHITCRDGDILGICENSHSWFGGNMAIRFADNTTLTYMGHICGPHYLHIWFDEFSAKQTHAGTPITSSGFKIFSAQKIAESSKTNP